MKSIILILSIYVHGVLCFWRRNADLPETTPTVFDRGQLASGRVTPSGIDELGMAINQWNTLKAQSQRSDCFKDASLALYKSCESLEFELDARVKVAVHMALCELSTADRASLPLECKSLRAKSTPKSVSQCVEALARSAQHWSSYSGYLRETHHAKSIYANITNEKVALLFALDGHYSKLAMRQQELVGLTQGLESILSAFEQYSLNLDRSLAEVPQRANELTSKVYTQVTDLLEVLLADTRATSQHWFANLDQQLAVTISKTQMALSSTAKDMQGDVEAVVGSLEAVALSWNSRLVTFNRRLDVMWDETFDRKLALEHALDDMRTRISEAGAQVDLQLAATERLQKLSSEASASMQHANTQIASVSTALFQELGGLVSITQELQNNITRMPSLVLNSRWLPDIFGPLSSIANGIRFPAWQVQLAMHVVGVGASGIQNSLSLLLTFACALLFVTSHALCYLSHLAGSLLKWCSSKRKLSYMQTSLRPPVVTQRRIHRSSQMNHSRLSSMLPHYETVSV